MTQFLSSELPHQRQKDSLNGEASDGFSSTISDVFSVLLQCMKTQVITRSWLLYTAKVLTECIGTICEFSCAHKYL